MNNRKNILITGCNGQLGTELSNILSQANEHNLFLTDVDTLDICDETAVNNFIASHNIHYIVNCAAYTAVDKAEENQDICRAINADAVEILGRAATEHSARLISISTDYVFDGTSCSPYTEDMLTNPVSVYGATKLEGEQRLFSVCPEAVVIRTAWLYSPYGKNFVKTMIELGKSRSQLNVVFDQVGSPTYALDLAAAIARIIDAEWTPGIYHFSNEGAISWYDFTMAIHRLAGITSCQVLPCRSSEFFTLAKRPAYSVFDKSKIKNTFALSIPHWEKSLEHCITRILNN